VNEQTKPSGDLKRPGLRVLMIMAIPLAILLALIMPLTRPGQHPLHLKTCLMTTDRLRKGAEVRISGVVVGTVQKIQVQADDHACPIAVEMELRTGYALRIPRDSKTYSANAGLLGDAYVGIDSSTASGTPIENWGTLPSKVVPQMGAGEFVNDLDKSLQQSVDELNKSMQQQSRTRNEKPQTTTIAPK
jgi:ABC-type transporter Mla subunit MlaD